MSVFFPEKKKCDEASEFQCGDGTCILQKFVCDGKNDCNDTRPDSLNVVARETNSSDEWPSSCSKSSFEFIFCNSFFYQKNFIWYICFLKLKKEILSD